MYYARLFENFGYGKEIRLNGIPIQEYDYDSYMSAFSAVFQDYRLFSFSLEENVTLARPAEEGKAEDALRRAGRRSFIYENRNCQKSPGPGTGGPGNFYQ